ncbi:hypothetical protein [Bacillus sp. NPDC077027]|uniref:hypothetical protein n=1 Tax=Bacillus sp. NPDC077027 TaxID=3390548 RepID=UPI003D08315A
MTTVTVVVFGQITSPSLLKNEQITVALVMKNDRPVADHLSKCPVIRTKNVSCLRKANGVFA